MQERLLKSLSKYNTYSTLEIITLERSIGQELKQVVKIKLQRQDQIAIEYFLQKSKVSRPRAKPNRKLNIIHFYKNCKDKIRSLKEKAQKKQQKEVKK